MTPALNTSRRRGDGATIYSFSCSLHRFLYSGACFKSYESFLRAALSRKEETAGISDDEADPTPSQEFEVDIPRYEYVCLIVHLRAARENEGDSLRRATAAKGRGESRKVQIS